MTSYKCVLKSVGGTHPSIPLPHKQKVIIGRTPQTCIKDKRVSRKQLALTADCIHREIKVHQLGSNPCFIGDKQMHKGSTGRLKADKTLYILGSKHYPYQAIFKITREKHGNISIESLEQQDEAMDAEPSTSKDLSEDDDDEHVKAVQAKLNFMKQTVQAPQTKRTIARTPGGGDSSDGDDRLGEPLTAASWMEKDTLMVHKSKGLCARSKVAAFDIDGTIICTQSGKVFPVHPGDWRILYPDIPGCLKKLHRDGYKIVFITNQMGIQRGKVKIPDFQQKVESIIAKLGVPVHVLVSKGAGPYRKPGQGMWAHLTQQDNDGIKVNIKKSMYIGDAAGRPKDWEPKKKKDFSCGDRLFAINAGLKFQTPEEYFLKKAPAKFDLPEFNPTNLDANAELLSPSGSKVTLDQQEVIVCVGSPASGKSHFVKEYLVPRGYVHVNRDELKSWQKCVILCQKSLEAGKSVVIDNTNPDKDSRKRYTDVAGHKKVACRCFLFMPSMQQVKHNERFREFTDKSHQSINDMILNTYKTKFREPTTEEGFAEIIKVNFVPKFEDREQEKLYKQYLVEK